MRIDLATLDPASPLARRIHAVLSRETPAEVTRKAARRDIETDERCTASDPRTPPAAKSGALRSVRSPAFTAGEETLHRAIVAMIVAEASPGVIVFHVPNGGRRGKAEAGRLKAMGTLAGMPDLIVIANGRCHGLEIKTDRGRLSTAQKAMAVRFARAGCPFEVARSVGAARTILASWGARASRP